MPVRTLLDKSLLEAWLTEFRALGYLTGSDIRVLDQEDETDPDSGLIVVDLTEAKTITYLQPITGGDGSWKATMEARDATIELGAVALVNLGNEVNVLGALVSFLEAKSKALLAAG
ncbi:hypothetical protein QE418_001930 [Microbacterium testaceum]|uniref:hypothetical protein n=1 Tax=Microbacterium TaxID=33882 RepID=UPI001AEB0905|nr:MULTISPECIES: hypothetical protein [Microbacterium]MDQ1112482.1 hypothetical protein [Microbacterium testaceum]MDQ1175659.1 hypothetical protein [Microbacterium sp. SORGH_AS_0421]MDR6096980.1 hypothetical protein [Microbacterium sp. SORGH_AS_0454]WAC69612.1 hypothetical protein OVA17_02645 [Microbacterium sp. SL75]